MRPWILRLPVVGLQVAFFQCLGMGVTQRYFFRGYRFPDWVAARKEADVERGVAGWDSSPNKVESL